MIDQIPDNSLSYESAVYLQPISHIKIAKTIWGRGRSARVGIYTEYMHFLSKRTVLPTCIRFCVPSSSVCHFALLAHFSFAACTRAERRRLLIFLLGLRTFRFCSSTSTPFLVSHDGSSEYAANRWNCFGRLPNDS